MKIIKKQGEVKYELTQEDFAELVRGNAIIDEFYIGEDIIQRIIISVRFIRTA